MNIDLDYLMKHDGEISIVDTMYHDWMKVIDELNRLKLHFVLREEFLFKVSKNFDRKSILKRKNETNLAEFEETELINDGLITVRVIREEILSSDRRCRGHSLNNRRSMFDSN